MLCLVVLLGVSMWFLCVCVVLLFFGDVCGLMCVVCMCVVHMCVFLTYVLVCTFFGGICQCVFCRLYGCCVDQITKIHYN